MKSDYERTALIITEFDVEDVITTSGVDPEPTTPKRFERENAYRKFSDFGAPGSWF